MLNVSGDGTAVANATDAIATLFNITGENATFVNASCQDLRELSSLNKAAFSERMLEAARMSAEQWAATTSVLSVVSSVLDVFIVVALVAMRRHRPIQRQGLGFLICLVVGCFLGHMASILDSRQPSAALCRGRLAVIYMFIYGLLAPLFGKLISLCRAANNVLLAGHASGWDPLARKVTYSLYGIQGISLIFYLALTAGKPSRKDRLQTVCSDAVSEHAFHFTDGFFAAAILLACFGMIAWLEVAALSNRDDSARHGSKDLLLCAIAVAGGALGLLLLLATSTQDIAWASAVVPVRLLIILLSAYTVLGFQVVPPLFVAVRDRLDVLLHPHGRRKQVRTEATIQKDGGRPAEAIAADGGGGRRAPARPPREPTAPEAHDGAHPHRLGGRVLQSPQRWKRRRPPRRGRGRRRRGRQRGRVFANRHPEARGVRDGLQLRK